ncbi:hypothetical protein LTR94_036067, partial [Friedmanniomyces endolithicus]
DRSGHRAAVHRNHAGHRRGRRCRSRCGAHRLRKLVAVDRGRAQGAAGADHRRIQEAHSRSRPVDGAGNGRADGAGDGRAGADRSCAFCHHDESARQLRVRGD